MGILADYADLFSDLAKAASANIADWEQNEPPKDSPSHHGWQLHMSDLSQKADQLESTADKLYDLDTQALLGSAKKQLEEIQQATGDAEKVIRNIAQLNKFLSLVGDFINVGVAIFGVISDPVAGAKGIVSAVSDLVDTIKAYQDKKYTVTKHALGNL